jgi:hypothetical protein
MMYQVQYMFAIALGIIAGAIRQRAREGSAISRDRAALPGSRIAGKPEAVGAPKAFPT